MKHANMDLNLKTKKWITCTPYFDVRNIYFYVNKSKNESVLKFLEPTRFVIAKLLVILRSELITY